MEVDGMTSSPCWWECRDDCVDLWILGFSRNIRLKVVLDSNDSKKNGFSPRIHRHIPSTASGLGLNTHTTQPLSKFEWRFLPYVVMDPKWRNHRLSRTINKMLLVDVLNDRHSFSDTNHAPPWYNDVFLLIFKVRRCESINQSWCQKWNWCFG